MMTTVSKQHYQLVENDDRAAEKRAIEHFERDLGMNYDGGFGSLLDDTAAADIAHTRRDHVIIIEE